MPNIPPTSQSSTSTSSFPDTPLRTPPSDPSSSSPLIVDVSHAPVFADAITQVKEETEVPVASAPHITAVVDSLEDLEHLVLSDDPEHPANMIPELCREFYKLGWVTGTGGGISIRLNDHVFLAPSGVQKERILPEHIFVLPFSQSSIPRPGSKRDMLRIPKKLGLKESACTPLFWNAFTMRNAGACIHTHSQHAVLLTLLLGKKAESFKMSHQEMIKGVRIGGVGKTLRFFDTLEIPIIENTADEEDLTDGMAEAMRKYPDAPAILVRRHGVYVWGNTWEQAKTQAECLDYLFEMATKMLSLHLPLVGDN
ncbi:methylthioribulose-1-phosphate dehydratase [Tremella mesenterica]|uniref:Methylthioribulose-1-phosphate dehydratase n=1 Tax=Tremella mesenterica TaxID=5217 RepID=A0A4Q1BT55_TREME|nr:methylthioribulose-1-phosphate dehydratase [Tremella mesenterica]